MSDCILWEGRIDKGGYGRRGPKLVHRVEYEKKVGPIPKGLTIDHLCHNADLTCNAGSACLHRRCYNVEHLEPVTRAENILRGNGWGGVNAKKTHCPQGHSYDETNTYLGPDGHRDCRTCVRTRQRATYRQRRNAVMGEDY